MIFPTSENRFIRYKLLNQKWLSIFFTYIWKFEHIWTFLGMHGLNKG